MVRRDVLGNVGRGRETSGSKMMVTQAGTVELLGSRTTRSSNERSGRSEADEAGETEKGRDEWWNEGGLTTTTRRLTTGTAAS